jgi:hypothetical protein
MYLQGMGSLAYYLGQYVADFSLFVVVEAIFAGFVEVLRLEMYTSQMLKFTLQMTSFGVVLIPFTYLFQIFFENGDSAFRLIGVFYLLLGLLIPEIISAVILLFRDTFWYYFVQSLLFFLDPFYTFYLGS